MLSEPDLQAVLQNIKPASAHGPFSRCVGLHHLVPKLLSAPADPPQPLWGLGSKQGGGRFTPRNAFETVYLAEDVVTALTEVIAVVTTLPGRPTTLETHPWAIVVVRGLLLSVLDLTRSDMVRKLGSSHQELTGAWRYTQEQTGEAPDAAARPRMLPKQIVRWHPLFVQQEPAARRVRGGFPGSFEAARFSGSARSPREPSAAVAVKKPERASSSSLAVRRSSYG
jgi:RES domain-containing protein